MESDSYIEARNELENDAINAEWNDKSDSDKLVLMHATIWGRISAKTLHAPWRESHTKGRGRVCSHDVGEVDPNTQLDA